jgi:hypothetical protein
MKNTIILLGIILTGIINLNAQDCYAVTEVKNKTENPDLSSKKFTFGLKQLTEELMGEKYSICEDGLPVNVAITSIESPTVGINIGPFMIKKKNTIL